MFEPHEKNAGIIRYRLWPGEPVDQFALNMIQQNAPRGVMMLGRETTEEGDFLLLPVAGLVPITSKEFRYSINFSINNFIIKAGEVRDSLEEYMIPKEEFVLRPEWAWWDPEKEEPVFLVLPTPSASDLSLSIEEYEILLKGFDTEREESAVAEKAPVTTGTGESANESAKRKTSAKPLREVIREFWNRLD